jgi:DNA gyrase subunit B
VGVTVVNFLSEWCEVEVRRGGHVYQQEYERGEPTSDVRRIGITDRLGTKTTFKPDPQIFPNTQFSYNILHKRLQEMAFLTGQLIRSRRATGEGTFQYDAGSRIRRVSEPPSEPSTEISILRGDSEGVPELPCGSRPNTENLHSSSTTSTPPKAARI